MKDHFSRMSIVSQTVAKTFSYIIGVDTHAKKHVYVILTNSGEHIETRDFPTTAAGLKRAIIWAGRRTGGDASTLWVIEGAASYGAVLTGAVTEAAYAVAEAPSGYQKTGRGIGKTDPLDAQRIAAAVLPIEVHKLRVRRINEGARPGLRVLAAPRDMFGTERTRYVKALTALLRVTLLGIDARRLSTIYTAIASEAVQILRMNSDPMHFFRVPKHLFLRISMIPTNHLN